MCHWKRKKNIASNSTRFSKRFCCFQYEKKLLKQSSKIKMHCCSNRFPHQNLVWFQRGLYNLQQVFCNKGEYDDSFWRKFINIWRKFALIWRKVIVKISENHAEIHRKNKGETFFFLYKFRSFVKVINPIMHQGKYKYMSSNQNAMRY